ncbi:MAG: hypothetical protein AAF467_14470 [Actinomycetota bacterium]
MPIAIVLSLAVGCVLGAAWCWWRRERTATRFEQLWLNAEAETDRLRMQLHNLQPRLDRLDALELDARPDAEAEERLRRAEETALAEELAAARAPTAGDRADAPSPEIEIDAADLALTAADDDVVLADVPPNGAEIIALHDRGDRVTATAFGTEGDAALAEMPDVELQAVHLDLKEARRLAEQPGEAEVMALRADVDRLKHERDEALARADEFASRLAQATPPVAPVGAWQAGVTALGIAGAAHSDDLKVIRGIGPAMERMLNENGICSWEQLATLDDEGVAAVGEALPAFPGRIRRDDWVRQAQELVEAFPLTEPYQRPTQATYQHPRPTAEQA